MFNPILDHPAPDFGEFVRVMMGKQAPRRLHLIELGMDGEILRATSERYLGGAWLERKGEFTETAPEAFYEQTIHVYHRLGYDCAPIWATWPNHPLPRRRVTANTAELAAGSQRNWIEEGQGIITTWEEFEQFPWDAVYADTRQFEYAARHLPEGMKLTANTSFFEHIFENLLGFEALAYLLFDQPALVEAIFNVWGQKVYAFYEAVVGLEAVGAIFHADDMGFKTSTLLSPDTLRRLVLPWHKKFAALAHAYNKPFFLHSCGNLYKPGLIEDLIEDVGIDGLHSFQDVILPVWEFKRRYGERIATLGGIDMDALVRYDEPSLRKYVQRVLSRCAPGGRFALGTGNTVANYIPVDNFIIILEESRKWPF